MSDYAMVVTAPGGVGEFRRKPIDPPEPGAGEVRLRQRAIGLNFLDVYHRSGLYPWAVPSDLVPGSEGAGTVEAIGDGVDGFAPGDRVAYTDPLGAYATVRTIRADRLVRIPDGIDDDLAASLMLKGLTAHYLINDSFRPEPGMTVLVHAAAGGVGLLLGQWLRARGVRAIGTVGSAAKVTLALAHGYDAVIDYGTEDFVARVRDLTGGAGVHAVYDAVGKDTWRGSLACLCPRGHFVNFGQASGPIKGFALTDLSKGSFHATRPVLFHFIADPAELAVRGAALFAALKDGILRSEVRQNYPLHDVARAHAELEARRTVGASVLRT